MNDRDFEVLRNAVLTASALEPEVREAYLARQLDREELRAEARALLAVDTSEVDRYENGGMARIVADTLGMPSQDPEIGAKLGPYQLEAVLGHGGMGVVYLAHQREPIERDVALKLLRANALSPLLLRRFELEQQLLGRLDHPNIARVLDASQTADGRPFFVLEYVAGVPIGDYCQRQKLTLRDRLVLFLQVCRSVDHAHRRGIVHRDLKPSNILVAEHDGRPVVKVIDFGIARVIEEIGAESTFATSDGHILGTPHYMSPEQARGERTRVDTRSDLYSLGVVLHEIVTDTLPYELQTTSIIEVLRVITQEPAKVVRHASTGQKLPSDVRTILIRALEAEPDRRYATVRHFADDIERFLDHLPVLARRPSSLYVFRKLAERHPLATATLVTLFVVSIAAAASMSVLYQRQKQASEYAAREADRSAAVLSYMESILAAASPGTGGPERTVGEVLAAGVEQAHRDFGDRPGLRAVILRTLSISLGHNDRLSESDAALHAAFEASEEIEPPDPILSAQIQLALAGLARLQGDGAGVVEHAQRGLALLEHAPETDPDLRPRLYYELGLGLRTTGSFAEAESVASLNEAYWLRRSGPESMEYAGALATSAEVLIFTGKPAQAVPLAERATSTLERLDGPESHAVIRGLNLIGLASASIGDEEKAIDAQQRALASVVRLFGSDHSVTAVFSNNLSTTLMRAGRFAEAEPLSRDADRIWRATLGEGHPNIATSHNNLGCIALNQLEFGSSEGQFLRALAILDSIGSKDVRSYVIFRSGLAFAQFWSGEIPSARKSFEQVLRDSGSGVTRSDQLSWYPGVGLAMVLVELGELDQATALCDTFLAGPAPASPTERDYHEYFQHVRARAIATRSLEDLDRESFFAARAHLIADETPLAMQLFELARGEALLRDLGESAFADENARWLERFDAHGVWPTR